MKTRLFTTAIIVFSVLTSTPLSYACEIPPEAILIVDQKHVFLDAVDGETLTLDGSYSSDPDDGIGQYSWDFDGEEPYDYTETAQGNDGKYTLDYHAINEHFVEQGTYTIYLKVEDVSGGNASYDTFEIFARSRGTITINVPADRPTIQDAIDVAVVDDDEVVVAEGTYHESIDFGGKEITVRSSDPTDWEVVANTIIDGPDRTTSVAFSGSENSNTKLQGFTITDSALSEGLEARWKFDESSGDTAYDAVGDKDGELKGSPLPTWSPSGYDNGAISLDEEDEYVEITNYEGVLGSSSRTFSAWIKAQGTSNTYYTIASWGNDNEGSCWMVTLGTASYGTPGALQLLTVGDSISGSTYLRDNQWHHVAVVLPDGGSYVSDVLLYVDGVKETTSSVATVPINTGFCDSSNPTTSDVLIGRFYRTGAALPFEGLIDDVRIYDRALGADEIASMAYIDPGMAAYWKFNGDAEDYAGDNDGIVHWEGTGVTFVDGLFGQAAKFKGDGEWHGADDSAFIEIDGSGIYNTYSISVWFKPDEEAGYGFFSDAHGAGSNTYGRPEMGMYDSRVFITGSDVSGRLMSDLYTSYKDGEWHHAVGIGDAGSDEVKLYIDGEYIGLNDQGYVYSLNLNNGGDSDNRFEIGARSRKNHYYKGLLDDMRIYPCEISASKVRQLYTRSAIHGNGVIGAVISNCIIRDNRFAVNGGGISDFNGDIISCIITNNKAENRGGGLADCHGKIINCIIAHNDADTGGGLDNCDAQIINCTIVKNNATTANEGGGLNDCDTTNNANAEITNCIIYANQANESPNQVEASVGYTYSCVQGCTESNGNINDSPEFVDTELDANNATTVFADLTGPDAVFGTIDDGLRLKYDSSCIDVGDNSAIDAVSRTEDITEATRKIDVADSDDGDGGTAPLVDMGAYETPAVFYVDKDAPSEGDGESWATAFDDLSTALASISVPTYGCEIWVAEGSYTTASSSASFTMADNMKLYGGFSGTEKARAERDYETKVTILAGDVTGIDFSKVVELAINVRIDGFTVSGGNAGIYAYDKDACEIFNCIVKNNLYESVGGYPGYGIVVLSSDDVVISNCTVKDNERTGINLHNADGACIRDCVIDNNWSNKTTTIIGIYCHVGSSSDQVTIERCVISNNKDVQNNRGYGFYASGSGSCELRDCDIYGHRFGVEAQAVSSTRDCRIYQNDYGLRFQGGTHELENCLVYDNTDQAITALDFSPSAVTINNCTIAGNYGGIYRNGTSQYVDVNIKNSIVYGNTPGGDFSIPTDGIVYANYNCIGTMPSTEKVEGIGNISCDPLFVGSGDYHLTSNSLCIDAGQPWVDYSNEPAPNGGRVNLGCYGNTSEAATTVDVDGDGLPDAWEKNYFSGSTVPGAADDSESDYESVDDGITNWQEYLFNNDPTQYTGTSTDPLAEEVEEVRLFEVKQSGTSFDPTLSQTIVFDFMLNLPVVIELSHEISPGNKEIWYETPAGSKESAGPVQVVWDGTGTSDGLIVEDDTYSWQLIAGTLTVKSGEEGHLDSIALTYDNEITSVNCNPSRIITTYNEVCKVTFSTSVDADMLLSIFSPDDLVNPVKTVTILQGADKEFVWDGKNTAGLYLTESESGGLYTLEVRYDGMREKATDTISVYK